MSKKGQKDKRSTNHQSCSTSGILRVTLITNPVLSHERGKDRVVLTSGTYPWSFVRQIFRNG